MRRRLAKVIRDPIWGDIRLSDEEVSILDSPVFQRLRRIKQLGLAYLVYPSAVHTRFEHSIGTLEATQKFIEAVDPNHQDISDEERAIARAVALLHDIGHVPFAHLLEDEGRFYTRHDAGVRTGKLLAKLGVSIPAVAETILKREAVRKEHRFVEDMVFNTICADLMDYIRRDGYFTGATGLGFRFDERILRFFKIDETDDGSRRLVLEPTTDKIRLDVITDLLQLLRYRYVLTERVTFHHAKLAASAMLLKAVHELGPIPEETLHEIGDDEFLHSLRAWSQGKPTQHLVEALLTRHLHKPVFRVTRNTITKSMTPAEFAKKFGTPEGRANLEEEIAKAAGKLLGRKLGETSICVYASPDADMTFKEVQVLVRWRGKSIQPLRDITPDEYWETQVHDEARALEDKYRALWTAYVFLDRKEIDYSFEVERACSKVLQIDNDPLLRKALGQRPTYEDMTTASRIVADMPLARQGIAMAQRGPKGLSSEERIRRGVEEAIRVAAEPEKGKPVAEKSKVLDEFESGEGKTSG